ncbi:MAG: MarC family protein [Actinomycetales bacterium]
MTVAEAGRFAIEVFVTLFVIVDPVGTVPLFLSLTSGRSRKVRRRLSSQAVTVSFLVITVFALFGQTILRYLGITLPSLQCAGGLLLLLVALELLTGRADQPTETANVNVALVPLGTPLLAGPGAIAATIVFVQRVDGPWSALALALGIVALHLVLWLALRYSVGIITLIKEGGVTLVTRISGLLLSAIAVQLVVDAVRAFIATS